MRREVVNANLWGFFKPGNLKFGGLLTNMQTTSDQNPATVSENAYPPMSLSKFIEETGLSPTTIWRYRSKGWLKTFNIAGRQYISRAAIAEFNRRCESGEFSAAPANPSKLKGGTK